jgi:hypothetical protein
MSGSSGCNSYQAGYEVDGNNITISLPISTMMACAESDGMMEQEQESDGMMEQEQVYLTAIGIAATQQISGDSMEVRTSIRPVVASFQIVK